MANDAYIYDAVRTPRGKGKAGKGTLYEVRPIELLVNLFNALKERNHLDTSKVEDVIIGCVTPIGDQGGNIAKTGSTLCRLGFIGSRLSIESFLCFRFRGL
jgi:acetyl-CoA C-acetyltransferase